MLALERERSFSHIVLGCTEAYRTAAQVGNEFQVSPSEPDLSDSLKLESVRVQLHGLHKISEIYGQSNNTWILLSCVTLS